MSSGGGTSDPLRGDTGSPIEDPSEDKEDKRGAHAPNGTKPPTAVGTFALEPTAPKGHRTKKKPPTEKPEKISKAERYRGYVAAFQSGYSRGVGQQISLEGIKGPDHVLVRCCKTHAKSPVDGSELRGPDLLAWIESKAEEFGNRFGNVPYVYHKFNDWLNGSASSQPAAQRPIGAQPAGKNEATSWQSGLSMTDEDRKNLGVRAKAIDL